MHDLDLAKQLFDEFVIDSVMQYLSCLPYPSQPLLRRFELAELVTLNIPITHDRAQTCDCLTQHGTSNIRRHYL